MQSKKTKNAFRIIFIIVLMGIATLGIYDFILPESISVFSNNAEDILSEEIALPFVSASFDELPATKGVSVGDSEKPFCVSLSANTKFFGIVPLKSVNVNVYDEITLCPGGMPFGVKLYTDGVIVAGITGVQGTAETHSPASDCGLKTGDIIKNVNGNAVNTIDEIASAIEQSGGKSLSLSVDRNGKELSLTLTPVLSKDDNQYRAGLWLRDSTAGIGTVTFISPQNGFFAGLGHGICDVDTGNIMPLRKGTVVDVTISGITKGIVGSPGELKGTFIPGKIGALTGNTHCGVYGVLSDTDNTSLLEPVKIGLKNELKLGKAEIYCTISDTVEKYSAEIVKIGNKDAEQKNFVIKITDKRLLDATGGIVQGMSGSPIIQNGKLVGAVTHVLVNDPTKGYGIFIENMLKNMTDTT